MNLSGKLEQRSIELYELITSSAKISGLRFMLVGATARDFILEWGYGVQSYRGTLDVDFGVRVSGWDQFEALKTALLATGKFSPTRSTHRLQYNTGYPIDIIPFGEISAPDHHIEWPPDQEIHMNVAGFEDAYQHSITIILRNSPHLEIQIASLANQMVLKLIAWKDRGNDDNRDARDITQIIKHYGQTVNMDRLFEGESEVMEMEGHDIDLAGARLLGRDIARSTGTELRSTVLRILREETAQQDHNRLAEAMTFSFIGTEFQQNLLFLKKIESGLTDD